MSSPGRGSFYRCRLKEENAKVIKKLGVSWLLFIRLKLSGPAAYSCGVFLCHFQRRNEMYKGSLNEAFSLVCTWWQ